MRRISIPAKGNRTARAGTARGRYRGTALMILFLIPLSGVSIAQEGEPDAPKSLELEALVPGDTLFFMKCSGVDQLLAEGKALDLVKLWNDPEVKGFFAEAIEAIPDFISEEEIESFPFKQVWNFCRGKVALAWIRGLPVLVEGNVPAVVLGLDLGEDELAFTAALNSFLEQVAWAKNLEQGEVDHRGIKINYFGKSGDGLRFHYATVKNLFLATMNLQTLQEIIDHHLDGKPALADTDAFGRSVSRAAGEGMDFLTYIQVKPFLKNMQGLLPYPLGDWMDLLGMNGLEAACLAFTLEGGGSRDCLYLHCPEEKPGILKALCPRPVSIDTLEKTPPATLIFLGAVVDLGALMKELEQFAEKAFPDQHQRYRREWDEFQAMVGLNLETDILPALGDECSFFMTLPKGGGMTLVPDIIMTVTVENEEAYLTLEDKFIAILGGMLDVGESTYGEQVIRHITIPGSPAAPAFAMEGGRLLIATTPMTMKKYLKWRGKEEPGLTGSQEFGGAMAGVPDEASTIGFFNIRSGVEMGYTAAAPFLPAVLSNSDLPLDPAMLPMTETLTEYIHNGACYAAMDEQGLCLWQRSPLGFGALLSMAVSSMDYFMNRNMFESLMSSGEAAAGRSVAMAHQRDPELGEVFQQIREGRYADADRNLTRWIDRHPAQSWSKVWALRNRGDCRSQQERYEEAVEDYTLVAEMDENSRALAYYEIARVYAKMGDAGKAIEALQMAVSAGHKLFYEDPELEALKETPAYSVFPEMVMVASTLMMEGQYDEAANFFTEWLFNHPYHEMSAWALKSRGDCFVELDRLDEAIMDYEKAVKRNDQFKSKVYYNIACICSNKDQGEQAIDYLKQAMDAGFSDFEMMDYDADLDNIRSDPRFRALRWKL